MNIREIHIDDTNRCRVVAGPAGRTFFSTPQAVGIALLGMPPEPEGISAPTGILWSDYLRTHGVAVGIQGDRQGHLVILPPRERTVLWTGPGGAEQDAPARLTVTFPHLLVALLLRRGVFTGASIFLPDMARQSLFSTTDTTPLLASFPYGNVYRADDGGICWGRVRTADIRTIQDVDTVFFGSGFNHDLYQPEVVGHVRLGAAVMAAPHGVLPPLAARHYNVSVPLVIASLWRQPE